VAPSSALRAVGVLQSLGDAGLPPLLAFATNQQAAVFLRQHVVMSVGLGGSSARPAVPTLLSLLADPNPTMRGAAIDALFRIDIRIWKLVEGVKPPPRRRDPGMFIPVRPRRNDGIDLD